MFFFRGTVLFRLGILLLISISQDDCRYLVLNCLLEAAKELSEPPKVEKVHVKETKIINNVSDVLEFCWKEFSGK